MLKRVIHRIPELFPTGSPIVLDVFPTREAGGTLNYSTLITQHSFKNSLNRLYPLYYHQFQPGIIKATELQTSFYVVLEISVAILMTTGTFLKITLLITVLP
jgi:hypothetical protein